MFEEDGTALEIAELARRVANLLRLGTIAEADYGLARARVRIGDLLTDWRPWLTFRAGPDATWWAPEVGEQALVLSPSGDLVQGVILPALYSTAHPAPADRETIHRMTYADGAVIEYDRAAHVAKVVTPGDVEVSAGGMVTVDTGADIVLSAGGSITITTAEAVTVTAKTATVSADSLELGGAGGELVARLGDEVEVGAGSSAGRWPIVTSASKVRAV